MTYYSGTGMRLGYGASTGNAPTVDTLFLKNDGNVGIGTTNPSSYKLQVVGAGGFTTSVNSPIFQGQSAAVTFGNASYATTITGSTTMVVVPTSWTATPTVSGLITATSGLTSNGTFTANGQVVLGDGGDDIAINSNDWDISSAGAFSGVTTLTASGEITSGGYLNLTNDNLLHNGDFETNTMDGWSGITSIVTGGYAGNYTAQFTGSTSFVSDDYIPVDPVRDVIQLEAYVKKTVAGGTPGVLYFGYYAYDASKTLITSAPCGSYCYFATSGWTVPVDSAWHKVSATSTGEGTSYPNFPVGTKYIKVLGLVNYSASGDAVTQIDHISLKRINNGPLFVGNNFNATNWVDQYQTTKLYTNSGNHFYLEPPSNGHIILNTSGTGNIGIGTTNPGAKLDIISTATTTNVTAITASALTSGYAQNINVNGAAVLTTGGAINIVGPTSTAAQAAGSLLKIATTGAVTGTDGSGNSLQISSGTLTGTVASITGTGAMTTTGDLLSLIANSATTPTGLLTITANGLTTGTAQYISSTSTALTTGGLFSLYANGAPAASWSGNLAKIEYNNADADVDGSALKVGILGAGAGDGTALNVTTQQTGVLSFALRVNDDGTYTDTTPFVVDRDGNVGVGTTGPVAKLDVGGGDIRMDSIENAEGYRLRWGGYWDPGYPNKGPYIASFGYASGWGQRQGLVFYTHEGLYSTDPAELAMAMRNGNIGIGTTNPGAYKLNVASGNTYLGGTVTITGGSPGANKVLTSDASGLASWIDISGSGGAWSLSTNDLYPDSTAHNVSIGASAAGSAKLYVNGNVGIGTTAPEGSLVIYGENNNAARPNFNIASASGQLRFYNWHDGMNYIESENATATASQMLNFTGHLGNEGTFNFSGNVGIGNTAPAAKLDIYNSSPTGYADVLKITANRSDALLSGNGISWYSSVGDTFAVYNSGRIVSSFVGSSSYADARLILQTPTGVGTFEDTLTAKGGNVGIGTTNPSQKLDIQTSATNSDVALLRLSTNTDWTTGIGTGKQLGIEWFDSTNHTGHITETWDGTYTNMNFGGLYDGGYKTITDQLMTIRGNGNVGIGTTAPLAKLVVSGTSYFGGKAGFGPSGFFNAGTVTGLTSAFGEFASNDPANSDWALRMASSTASGDASALLLARSRGTIASPTAITSGDLLGAIAFSGYQNAGFRSGAYILGTVDGAPSGSNVPAAITFNTVLSGVTFYERMRVASSGNIGIGTTNPTERLEINSIPAIVGAQRRNIRIIDPSNVAAGVGGGIAFGAFYDTAKTVIGDYGWISGVREDATNNSQAGNLILGTYTAGSVLTEAMRIKSNGNVGIGTTNPGYKLNVQTSTDWDGIVMMDGVNPAGFIINNAVGGTQLGLQSGATRKVQIETDGVTYFNGGYVGIGTTNPAAYLEINNETTGLNTGLVIRDWSETDFISMGVMAADTGYINVADSGGYRNLVLQPNGGNVGVGTATPLAKFQVGAVTFPSEDVGVVPSVRIFGAPHHGAVDSTVLRLIRDTNNGVAFGAGADLRINAWDTLDAGDGYLPHTRLVIALKSTAAVTETANVDVMSLLDSGNVGIGTTSPVGRLHIYGANNAEDLTIASSSGQVKFLNWSNNINYIQSGNGANNASQVLAFTGASGNSGIFDFVGSVGIGTTSPQVSLHIVGSNNMLKLENVDTNANQYSQINLTAGTQVGAIWTNNQNSAGFYGGSGALNLWTGQASPIAFFTNGITVPEMVIGSGGYVGIGTTSPAARLNVIGTFGSYGATLEVTNPGTDCAGCVFYGAKIVSNGDAGIYDSFNLYWG